MIFNAKLLRIDTTAAPKGGVEQWAAGAAISIDCCLDEPNSAQRWAMTQLQSDATAVLYVPMGVTVKLLAGMRVRVQLNNEASQAMPVQELAIRLVKDRVHGDQSHYECFVRAVKA